MAMKIIHKTKLFQFSSTNRRNPNKRGIGQKIYTISVNHHFWVGDDLLTEIQRIIDPKGNKGTKHHWVFKDREEAEKKFNWLMMRFAHE